MIVKAERKRLKDLALGGAVLPDGMDRIAEAVRKYFQPPPETTDRATYLAENKLYHFIRAAWPILEPGTPFVDSWHIGCVCEHLEALTNLEIRKLLINLPRRRGKSILAAVGWFCWAWIKNPWTRWGFVSYSSALSERDSLKCRDVIVSDWYQERWGDRFKIRGDQNAATRFANDQQGYRMSTSVLGKTIGFGGEYNCADDISNIQDAWSPTTLKKHAAVWTQGIHQSVNDPLKARFCAIMQRLNEVDLAGVLIAEDLGYETLILPEEYEPTRVFFTKEDAKASGVRDPIVITKIQRERPVTVIEDIEPGTTLEMKVLDPRTKENELLSPDRFPRLIVEEEKKSLGAYGTASQKQQRPAPLEGTIFQTKMFRYFREEIRNKQACFVLLGKDGVERVVPVLNCRFFQCIDTAQEISQQNDWTVVSTFALTMQADLLVYDVWRYRIEVPYQFEAFKCLRRGPCMWDEQTSTMIELPGSVTKTEAHLGNTRWPRKLLFQALEKASSGIGLLQQGRAAGMPFKELSADQNPIERVGPIASEYYAGKVYHKEGAAWVGDTEGELLGFPNAAHDDRVVTLAYGGYLIQHDAILRAHLNGDLFVSDHETSKAAEAIAAKRLGENEVIVNIPGVGGMKIDFPADR